jgi:hypothetical protein
MNKEERQLLIWISLLVMGKALQGEESERLQDLIFSVSERQRNLIAEQWNGNPIQPDNLTDPALR